MSVDETLQNKLKNAVAILEQDEATASQEAKARREEIAAYTPVDNPDDPILAACLDIFTYMHDIGHWALSPDKFEEAAIDYCDGLLEFPHRVSPMREYPNRGNVALQDILDFRAELDKEENEELKEKLGKMAYLRYSSEDKQPLGFVRRPEMVVS